MVVEDQYQHHRLDTQYSRALLRLQQHLRLNQGGNTSGNGTSPERSVTIHVPQVPEVQFVGIDTPASSASSTRVKSACTVACPSNCIPRKNRTTASEEMVSPQRPGLFRVQRPVCLLKNNPAFFIHLLNFVAPAPVRRMKSSRSSCAWM